MGHSRPGVILLLAGVAAIASTGLAAGGTAGVLLAVDLTGSTALSGLPVTVHVAGSAVAALVVSRQAGSGHRGRGLALGFALGTLGAVVVIASLAGRSLPGVLAGSFLLGAANASIFLARYAAVAASSASGRGRALGSVFLGTAVGAVISPVLLGPTGTFAQSVGLPPLTGLYLVAAAAFGCSGLLMAAASNPAVPWLGRAADVLTPIRSSRPGGSGLREALRGSRTRTALVVLAGTNLVMVGIMTVAPVHLAMHGEQLDVVGAVIALHVLAMFAPAPLTGRLADRFGPPTVILVGGALFVAGGVAGFFVEGGGVLAMTIHLLLIGFGWNCGVVGGSTLLAGAAVSEGLRADTEGIGEATMGIAAAVIAPVAGLGSLLGDYRPLSVTAAVLALVVLIPLRMSRPTTDPRSGS